jgi:hypothetical protein
VTTALFVTVIAGFLASIGTTLACFLQLSGRIDRVLEMLTNHITDRGVHR